MNKKNSLWVSVACLAAAAVILIMSFIVAPRPSSADEEAFGGTDSQVTSVLEEAGTTPWFSPLVELGSGEVESGLFALQAGIGAGIVGYAFGNLRGRRVEAEKSAAATSTSPSVTS